MTKAKEKPGDAALDYQQLAEHMLGSWQDQWRQFASNKENPFASAYGDWMSNWSSAMTGWTGADGKPATAAPAAKTTAEETSKHAAASTTQASDTRATPPVPPTAAAPSNARDVLLTELARRVEFLHERVVSLETELERIKSANK